MGEHPNHKRKVEKQLSSPKNRPKKKQKTGSLPSSRITSTLTHGSPPGTLKPSQPIQRNATPGPSTLTPVSAAVPSSKSRAKRKRDIETEESDSDLPDTIFPLPEPKRKPQASTKRPKQSNATSKKPKRAPRKRKGTVFLGTIEISSSSEGEILSTPGRPPLKRRRRKNEIIDLCSDEDPITSPSKPVRVQMEDNVVVVLSSDDEEMPVAPPPSKQPERRPSAHLSLTPRQGDISPQLDGSPDVMDERENETELPWMYSETNVSTFAGDANPLDIETMILSPALNVPLQALYDQALEDSLRHTVDADDNPNADSCGPFGRTLTRRAILPITYSLIPPILALHTPLFFARSIVGAQMLCDPPVNSGNTFDDTEGNIPGLSAESESEADETMASPASETTTPPVPASVSASSTLLSGLSANSEQDLPGSPETIIDDKQTSLISRAVESASCNEGISSAKLLRNITTEIKSSMKLEQTDSGFAPTSHDTALFKLQVATEPATESPVVSTQDESVDKVDRESELPHGPTVSFQDQSALRDSPDSNSSAGSSETQDGSPGPATPPSDAVPCFSFPDYNYGFLGITSKLQTDDDDDDDMSLSGLELLYPDPELMI